MPKPFSRAKRLIPLLLLFTSSLLSTTYSEDRIAFVFELIRHGARAGLIDSAEKFTVATGMLTPSGMRQRYFAGKMEREKYINEYQLIDPDYAPKQIYVQSTNIYRAIESGYSELLGLYPPSEHKDKLSKGEMKSLKSGKGMPPMSVQNAEEINEMLGSQAIVDGYV